MPIFLLKEYQMGNIIKNNLKTMSKQRPEVYKQKLLIALEKSLGVVTHACKEVGIRRETFYKYYNKDEKFRKAVDEINEITLDFAENQLLRKIKEGSERSIIFYLKSKGKKRGYADKLEIEGNMDINKITFEIINTNKKQDEE